MALRPQIFPGSALGPFQGGFAVRLQEYEMALDQFNRKIAFRLALASGNRRGERALNAP